MLLNVYFDQLCQLMDEISLVIVLVDHYHKQILRILASRLIWINFCHRNLYYKILIRKKMQVIFLRIDFDSKSSSGYSSSTIISIYSITVDVRSLLFVGDVRSDILIMSVDNSGSYNNVFILFFVDSDR